MTSSGLPFRSFWMGGFESAYHINRHGRRLDITAETQHDRFAAEDYARLKSVGIEVAREAVNWPRSELGSGFDFTALRTMIDAARRADIQVTWNLCHYGWPDGLDVFSSAFVDRFEQYARAASTVIASELPGPNVYTLINEMSFLSWAAGDAGGFIYPHARGRANELKHQFARAAIAGLNAVKSVDRTARFLHVDPIINVIPQRTRPHDQASADAYTEAQYESWDLIAGRLEPGLGGRPEYLDMVGVNYYHSNQWEFDDGRLRWEDEPRDDRWVPLREMLARVARRYERPVILAETSHFGAGRARWIREIAREVAAARAAGVPVDGVCLYPIIDRPDWEDSQHWHNSGLWDMEHAPDGTLGRVINAEYATAFEEAKAVVAPTL
jgi:beta-glucosidase/6-phospho-beta-glucosidase/beta-galactosidase